MVFSILLLGFFTSWRFKNLGESLQKIKIPEVEIPNSESFLPEEKEMKEFVDPDGELKLKYSSDWMEMPTESWQEVISAGAKTLFFAAKFKMERAAFASLVVQELGWKNDIKEIVEEIEKETKEKGGEMKILNLEIKNKEAYLKARYKKEEGNYISKEKIILGKERVYLISIFSLERFWSEFEMEAEEILNSIETI